MTPRAPAMAPEDRRESLIEATLPLLIEHGRGVTTRHIADAAGVAEGTIFRVFESKDDLVRATLARAVDPTPYLSDLRTIDPEHPLAGRLLDLVVHMQIRFKAIFTMMKAMGLSAPPEDLVADGNWKAQAESLMTGLIEPDAESLRCSPEEVIRLLRLLTFSGSHEDITDHHTLKPEQIVDVVLHGVLKEGRG